VYLPFCRRNWKESTAGTSEQIVQTHLVPEFGGTLLHGIRREELQDLLDRETLELSSSVVPHLRWFLSGIFMLTLSDGVVLNNPVAELRIPRKCQPGRTVRPLTEEEVMKYLKHRALGVSFGAADNAGTKGQLLEAALCAAAQSTGPSLGELSGDEENAQLPVGCLQVIEKVGAGDRGRTGDVQLGKLAFYH
jgi:hypothetical protein